MRRSTLGLLIILAILILASCSAGESTGNAMLDSRVSMLNEKSKTDNQRVDERAEQIINAIKEQDAGALKALYSEKALEEADNFDVEMESFFDFIEGDIISWERKWGYPVSESIDHGKRTIMYRFSIDIETDVDTYELYVFDYNVDTIEPENEGVCTLQVRTSGYTESWGPWQDRLSYRFYIPEMVCE